MFNNKTYHYDTNIGKLLYLIFTCAKNYCIQADSYKKDVYNGIIKVTDEEINTMQQSGELKIIRDAVKEMSISQSGGYYEKYMKYKAKYLQLKKI